MNKILEVENKIKSKEIEPKQEQLEMIKRKDPIKAEMAEVKTYLDIYRESFPENPAWAASGASKKPAAAKVEVEETVVAVPSEPAIDLNKILEDALNFVADTVILGTLNGQEGVSLHGTQNLNDALSYVRTAWTDLTAGAGTWSAAKGHFVDVFTRLVFKSQTQVSHTSKSYADLHAFITAFSASEGHQLFSLERTPAVHTHTHHHHEGGEAQHVHFNEEEEKGAAVEGESPLKEGESLEEG